MRKLLTALTIVFSFFTFSAQADALNDLTNRLFVASIDWIVAKHPDRFHYEDQELPLVLLATQNDLHMYRYGKIEEGQPDLDAVYIPQDNVMLIRDDHPVNAELRTTILHEAVHFLQKVSDEPLPNYYCFESEAYGIQLEWQAKFNPEHIKEYQMIYLTYKGRCEGAH